MLDPERPIGRRILYIWIFLAGVASFTHQMVWAKYLGALIGGHARATAILLAVVLGSVGFGQFKFGTWSQRKQWNPLKAFGVVQLLLAIWGLLFPFIYRLFSAKMGLFYNLFGVGNILTDLFILLLLIGTPAFLLGSLLPLLTQGLSPNFLGSSRRHLRLFGFSTVGAGVGAVLTSYILLPQLGLLPAMWVGALLNLCVGLLFYFVYPKYWLIPRTRMDFGAEFRLRITPKIRPFLLIALITGFCTVTLETVLIRYVGLSVGQSEYNFGMVVSIFVTALGFGALCLRRIARVGFKHLFWNQVVIALSLILVYLSGDYWPYAAYAIKSTLSGAPQNFYVFQIVTHLVLAILLLLPLALCGLSIPMCFHLSKERHETLGQTVGLVYGVHATGLVLGALMGGYALLYFFDLDEMFKLCIFLFLVSAEIILPTYIAETRPRRRNLSFIVTIVVLVAATAWLTPAYDKGGLLDIFKVAQIPNSTYTDQKNYLDKMTKGVNFLLYKDGPNTSIGITASSGARGKEIERTLFLNGRREGNTSEDRVIDSMLAHLPAILSGRLAKGAVIGFGTGITVGELLKYEKLLNLEVIEISEALTRYANIFDQYNGNVTSDLRLTFHTLDALRFFEGTDQKFDFIVSKPLHPWMAGVENLYSHEFFNSAKNRLHQQGVFVQSIHARTFTRELVSSVLLTMKRSFPSISIFQISEDHFAFVGTQRTLQIEDLIRTKRRLNENLAAKDSLKQLGFGSLESLFALEIVPHTLTATLAKNGTLQTIEKPRIGYEATKIHYWGSSVDIPQWRREFPGFFRTNNDFLISKFRGNRRLNLTDLISLRTAYCDNKENIIPTLCRETLAGIQRIHTSFDADENYPQILPRRDITQIRDFESKSNRRLTAKSIDESFELYQTYLRYSSPIAPISIRPLTQQLDRCLSRPVPSNGTTGKCFLQKVRILTSSNFPFSNLEAFRSQYKNWLETSGLQLIGAKAHKKAFEQLETWLSSVPKSVVNPKD